MEYTAPSLSTVAQAPADEHPTASNSMVDTPIGLPPVALAVQNSWFDDATTQSFAAGQASPFTASRRCGIR